MSEKMPSNPSAEDQPKRDENRDPITGVHGAHPVGTGVGAAVGGASVGAATGAVVGTVAGPVGMAFGAVLGAIAGAVAGGLAGKAVAEDINPTVEHDYWRSTYSTRPYVKPGDPYHQYAKAYQYGWESQAQNQGKRFGELEANLKRQWDEARGKSRLEWNRAKEAVQDAWERQRRRREAMHRGER